MTKVEIEKPVVSKELAERFEQLRGICPFSAIDLSNYSIEIKEKILLNNSDFSLLLAKMFVVEYEIEKPKLHYIVLNDETLDPEYAYLNMCESKHSLQLHTKNWKPNFKTQFTDEEAEEFLENAQKGMWHLEEVEYQ